MTKLDSSFRITKPVFFLGMVSFFTDVASESIYPLLPVFLTTVLGASAAFIGIVEGIAETTASVMKFVFGWLSDRWKKREPFVVSGYMLANLVRPLLGLAMAPWHVLALRFLDRVGKGMRTAPRDAWLASLAPSEARARVYGFHRAMDHAGAVIGPIGATVFLWFYPGEYRSLFLMAVVPGVLAVICVIFASKLRSPTVHPRSVIPESSSEPLPQTFKRFLAVLLLFTLGNSSDAFLLLKLKSAGVDGKFLPLLWAALHVVKSASSLVGGRLADSAGKKNAIVIGWFWYAVVYVVLGLRSETEWVVGFFLLYGIYFGLTEGAERALAADLVPSPSRGTAFGLYNLTIGIGALPASLLFGYLWTKVGMSAAFFTGAALAMTASLLILVLPRSSFLPTTTE